MENAETKKQIGYKDILYQKEYMKMCFASMINRFGDSIDAVAYTWVVYEITNSASWSAIIYALNLLPTIFITPFAGAWVESKTKKPIMVLTDLARAVLVAFYCDGIFARFSTAVDARYYYTSHIDSRGF